MLKEETDYLNLEGLFQNMGSGRNMSVLVFDSESKMQQGLRSIKFPFHLLHSYGMNGKHYCIVNSLRKIKIKEK